MAFRSYDLFQVAQHLKMNTSGEIYVIQPFDKQRYAVPQIVSCFITEARRLHNCHLLGHKDNKSQKHFLLFEVFAARGFYY